MRTTARMLSVALLSIGLVTGCAPRERPVDDSLPAQQAIAEAKAAHAKAKAVNDNWRDTGALIEQAEEKLVAGDNAEAIRLANEARDQANAALAQAEADKKKLLDEQAAKAAIEAAAIKAAAAAADAVPAGRVTSYSVVRGDNLWNISAKDEIYADPYQWPLIFRTNRDKIEDADLIHPGQVLDIDHNATASEIDAAVNHARTRGAWSVGDVEMSDREFLAQ